MKEFSIDDVSIMYEDSHILVAVKPQNIPSQADASEDTDLLTLLKNHIKQRDNKPGNVYLALLHRLDRVTGGLMVFAKNEKSASRLSRAIREREVKKSYIAVVLGQPREKQGTLVNYLKSMPQRIRYTLPRKERKGPRRRCSGIRYLRVPE